MAHSHGARQLRPIRARRTPGFTPGVFGSGMQEILQDIMPVLARLQMRAAANASAGVLQPPFAESAAAVALVSDMGAEACGVHRLSRRQMPKKIRGA